MSVFLKKCGLRFLGMVHFLGFIRFIFSLLEKSFDQMIDDYLIIPLISVFVMFRCIHLICDRVYHSLFLSHLVFPFQTLMVFFGVLCYLPHNNL